MPRKKQEGATATEQELKEIYGLASGKQSKQVNTIEKPVWKIEWQLGDTIDPDREADDSVMVMADTYWQAVRMVRRNAKLDEGDIISITSVTLFGGVLIETEL